MFAHPLLSLVSSITKTSTDQNISWAADSASASCGRPDLSGNARTLRFFRNWTEAKLTDLSTNCFVKYQIQSKSINPCRHANHAKMTQDGFPGFLWFSRYFSGFLAQVCPQICRAWYCSGIRWSQSRQGSLSSPIAWSILVTMWLFVLNSLGALLRWSHVSFISDFSGYWILVGICWYGSTHINT